MLLKKVLKILIYLQCRFDIISSSSFEENMNVSLPSNRILHYLKDILENRFHQMNC